MKDFVSIPTIESGLYTFGGHQHTVKGGWSFFEQRHQVFELMTVVEGSQLTEFRGKDQLLLRAGDAVIIAPGTYHVNRNASARDELTYICVHFDFEDINVRSQMIGRLANKLFAADTRVAKISAKVLHEIIAVSENRNHESAFTTQINVEILLLRYLEVLNSLMEKEKKVTHDAPYSDREAKIGRELAMKIENRIKREQAFSFSDLCNELAISTGYGHQVFKHVYGITPLHFANREKYRKAKKLLEYSENSVEEIAYMVGSANMSTFSKQFKKWSGYSPSEYRKQVRPRRKVRSKREAGYFE